MTSPKRRTWLASVVTSLTLAAASPSVLPALSASANTDAVVIWPPAPGSAENTPKLYDCSTPNAFTFNGESVIEVKNNCDVRIWLHQYDYANGTTVAESCINPGGIAYDFPSAYNSVQVTSNASQCDAGTNFQVSWGVPPGPAVITTALPYSCATDNVVIRQGYFVTQVTNTCNARIWLHQYDDGTGAGVCLSPAGTSDFDSFPAYWQLQVTNNQTPCNDGPPRY
jgi:hypothetical protein